MRMISTAALAAAMALGGAVLTAAPADAQKKDDKAAAEAPKRAFKLSKGVRENIGKAQEAFTKNDFATATAMVNAASPLAQTADDKYVVGQTKLQIAAKQNDDAGIATAIDEVIASGAAPADALPTLYRNQGVIAYKAKNYAKAEQAYSQLAQLTPDDGENLVALAEIKYQNGKAPEALDVIDKAIAAKKAANQPVSENWYKRALAIAYEGKLGPQTLKWSEAYVQAYPTPTNWRTALSLYRQDARLDEQADLDVLRLMRAAKALNGERDFYDYANTAYTRGLPGETDAVIREGTAANMVSASSKALTELRTLAGQKVAADKASLPASATRAKAAADGKPAMNTADAFLSYGDYAQAADLYKVAMTKGGVDSNVANTRLGIALARGGKKAEALQAFAAVQGARKTIADYWTIWLNQQA